MDPGTPAPPGRVPLRAGPRWPSGGARRGNAAPAYVFAPAARRPAARVPDDDPPRHVIHLAVAVPTMDDAKRLARRLCATLRAVPELDPGETTVSAEDAQHERHRVFCDVRLPGPARCTRPADHSGPCGG